ncbi:hypothetical protein L0F63_002090 [Massospora cicadina]|nr:hypothetical protein L0F63_002090 [Massospora cicadina]
MDKFDRDRGEEHSYPSRVQREKDESPYHIAEKFSRSGCGYKDESTEHLGGASDSDSIAASKAVSKRRKRDRKDRSSKKRKHKRKRSHSDYKHKDGKSRVGSGERAEDLSDDETLHVSPFEPQKLKREGWMTMDGLELDAFTVDHSAKRTKASRTINTEGLGAPSKDYVLNSGEKLNSDLVAQGLSGFFKAYAFEFG